MANEQNLEGALRAEGQTREAKELIEKLVNLHKKSVNFRVKQLYDKSSFKKRKPSAPSPLKMPEPPIDKSTFDDCEPIPPGTLELPPEPDDPPSKPKPQNEKYVPEYSLLDRMSSRRRQLKDREARAHFEQDLARWEGRRSKEIKSWQMNCARLQKNHNAQLKKYLKKKKKVEQKLADWEAQCSRIQKKNCKSLVSYEKKVKNWEKEKSKFHDTKNNSNKRLDELFGSYDISVNSLKDYLKTCFEKYFEKLALPENLANRVLQTAISVPESLDFVVINACLPNPPDMPSTKEFRYIKSRNELKETRLSERERNRIYDEFAYSLALALIRITFTLDSRKCIGLVTLNGWVRYRDEATGKIVEACIISLQVRRKEFTSVKLRYVDAKACFRRLKGVGSSKLYGLVPVAPLMLLDRDDVRFVASREVASSLEEGENLAAMDWEEFEHLVREIFEAQFAADGGEVKITRASRDSGVDAVAFDPDPIRGGKLVIQAKRYTNTVGVDSVRDLYGTVVNEGAIKGILITTSQYGPDAYEFARDKPLTLLDGSNLLHLLEKHGYKARIDLREAKQILAAEKR